MLASIMLSVRYGSSWPYAPVGLDEHQVKKYIEWQNKKELPQTSKLF